ncbi:unnamed protein product [Parascedosporium putredinis]|uniref:Methyltransferase domain-containing protein n=1 Tax=Parascedosporium putredinis TaxID=1442378 RepID=A0A9P1H252_9PEZI|nr:unnamed protein product [Parascedosporium putredinis]CAI7995774.1 unnamed protein product [Parascedosporium putredinis]
MGISEVIASHIGPWLFMLLALWHLPGTIARAARTDGLLALFRLSALRDAWFFDFWSTVSRDIRAGGGEMVTALPAAHPSLSGTVLEIGAGTGLWSSLLAREIPGVERVFGVEPNPESLAVLRKRVAEAGLGDKYVVVPAGVEDRAGAAKSRGGGLRIFEGGGRWYVYEHVRADGVGWWIRLYQGFLNLFWPFCIGGCQLTRPTRDWLLEAGPWSDVDLDRRADEPWHQCLPHIMGTLTK